MKKVFLICTIILLISANISAQNKEIDTLSKGISVYPYQIIMIAVSIDINTIVSVTPEAFETRWTNEKDTILISDPEIIRWIVYGIINDAKPIEMYGIDTRGKLILKYHNNNDVVLYYGNIDMLLDNKTYLINSYMTRWLDEIRKHSKD